MFDEIKSELPNDSLISQYYTNANFTDAYTVEAEKEYQSALDAIKDMFLRSPNWINSLMRLRNKAVSIVGIKDLGVLSDVENGKPLQDYKVGDRFAIFSIAELRDDEVVMTDNDKHLKVYLSLKLEPSETHGGRQKLTVTTVVHEHNFLGKFYMLFVGPAHKIIAPSGLKVLAAE